MAANPKLIKSAAKKKMKKMALNILNAADGITESAAPQMMATLLNLAAAPPPPAPTGLSASALKKYEADEKAAEANDKQTNLRTFMKALLKNAVDGAPPVKNSVGGTTTETLRHSKDDALTETTGGCGLKSLPTTGFARRVIYDTSS